MKAADFEDLGGRCHRWPHETAAAFGRPFFFVWRTSGGAYVVELRTFRDGRPRKAKELDRVNGLDRAAEVVNLYAPAALGREVTP